MLAECAISQSEILQVFLSGRICPYTTRQLRLRINVQRQSVPDSSSKSWLIYSVHMQRREYSTLFLRLIKSSGLNSIQRWTYIVTDVLFKWFIKITADCWTISGRINPWNQHIKIHEGNTVWKELTKSLNVFVITITNLFQIPVHPWVDYIHELCK